jgi:uncharacterized membrane protein AbrB (regulator of aidB expression)
MGWNAATGAPIKVKNFLFIGIGIIQRVNSFYSIPQGDVIGSWPLFAVGVTSVIAASGLVGWLMTRMHVLPGTSGTARFLSDLHM